MNEQSEFEIVVVGAGPAGLLAGLCCAASNLQTAVIGPLADSMDGRTAALLNGSVNLLKRLSIWNEIKGVSEPLFAIRLVDATGSLLRAPEVLFEASEIGLEAFGYNVPNAALTSALDAAAGARLTRIVSHGVTEFDLSDERARVATSEGGSITARLVVAADGRASAARTAAGIAVSSWSFMSLGTRDARNRDLGVSFLDFEDWRASARTFSDMTLMGQPTLNVSEEGRPPERYAGAVVSANLFRLIGEKPFLGPGFTDDDDRFSAPPRVVIGYGMWQTRYGGDPGMIGRTIKVDDLIATVAGVMPKGMMFPPNTEIWLPMGQSTLVRGQARNLRNYNVIGRLADGVTPAQAQAELAAIVTRLANDYPTTNKDITPRVVRYNDQQNGVQIRTVFWSLMGAVAFVLLIACANVANLLLARVPAVRARLPCACRLARRDGASCGNCWSRACCSRSSRVWPAWASRISAYGGSTPAPRTSASRTGWCSRWTPPSSDSSPRSACSPASCSAWRRQSTCREPASPR